MRRDDKGVAGWRQGDDGSDHAAMVAATAALGVPACSMTISTAASPAATPTPATPSAPKVAANSCRWFRRYSKMSCTSTLGRIGLSIQSSIPACLPSSKSRSDECVVAATMRALWCVRTMLITSLSAPVPSRSGGLQDCACSCIRIWRVASNPSMMGMEMSISTSAGRTCAYRCTASRPFSASTTSMPCLRSGMVSTLRLIGLSSTTSTTNGSESSGHVEPHIMEAAPSAAAAAAAVDGAVGGGGVVQGEDDDEA
ncbi:hypothetical protein PHBOTO_005532 [Pseudozyma hubeiensis]|nr:hypothetical protein PHBOTO_005532 [Pseudozyma hubeiensis]